MSERRGPTQAPQAQTVESPWLRTEAAATYLGIRPRTLRDWREQGFIQSYRVGRTVLYHRVELDAAVRARAEYRAFRKIAQWRRLLNSTRQPSLLRIPKEV